jgi:hypothetical protein
MKKKRKSSGAVREKFCRILIPGEGGKTWLNCFQNVTQAWRV